MTQKKSRPGLAPRSGKREKTYLFIIAAFGHLCNMALLYAALCLTVYAINHIPLPLAVAALLLGVHHELRCSL